jgi:hypothetical protein
MPTVPLYNQGATEEAGLTRAKRRVIKAMKSGILKLTDRPDMDPTNGSADQLANLLIGQLEDLTALSRQITSYMGDGSTGEIEFTNPDEAIRALKLMIVSARIVARILRLAKALAPNMRYLDLGILSDLKAVNDECKDAFTSAVNGLDALKFKNFTPQQMDTISNYQDLDFGSINSEFDDNSDIDTVGSISLGTKRTGSTADTGSKTVSSGSTISKRSPKGSKLGVPLPRQNQQRQPRPSRMNTMFRYMFGAAEDLRDAASLDRPPPGGKGTPRPRARRPRVDSGEVIDAELVDEDMLRAIQRGQRMASLEEEEFQQLAREEGREVLQQAVANDEQRQADIEVQNALDRVEAEKVPFTAFSETAYHDLLDMTFGRFLQAEDLLFSGFNNFNAYRQQRVLPATAADADVGNAIKTGSGMCGGFNMVQGTNARMSGNKVYTIGGSSDILYRREGLPRFL